MCENMTSEQHEVQRKLGRCLLRFQQYEKLLKAITAHQSIEGPGDKLQSIRDQKIEDLRTKTMGHLVGLLAGSYLSVEAAESADVAPDEPRGDVLRTGWFRTRTTIAMSPESYADTVQQLSKLVALRNDLVHHFIEMYDVWALAGCRDAVSYLDDAYARVDSGYASLAAQAKSMQDAHAVTAAFFASEAWEEFFVHGIAPEGTVDWPRATVVKLLQDAARAHHRDGWTNLADAIRRIGAQHTDQTPKRYGCASWRQVLHESKCFDIRRDKAMDASPGETWYRNRQAGNSTPGKI